MVDCRINGEIIIYPTRQACEAALGETDDLEAAVAAPLLPPETTLPIIMPLSPRGIVERYVETGDHGVLAEGLELFTAVFFSDEPTAENLAAWQEFVITLDSAALIDPLFASLIRLTQPNISDPDRQLLFNYIFTTGREDHDIVSQVRQQVRYHWSRRDQTWQLPNPHALFLSVLEAYHGSNYETFLGNILSATVEMEMFEDLSETRLLVDLDRAYQEVERYPWGSDLQRAAQLRAGRLESAVLASHISLRRYAAARQARQDYPALAVEEQEDLQLLMQAAQSYERGDNYYCRNLFANLYVDLYAQFVEAESGSSERVSLAMALDTLNQLAVNFAFSPADLAALRRPAEEERQAIAFDSLTTIGELTAAAPVSVGPAGLPLEVVELLQQTGYYELIVDNLQEIIFEINVDDNWSGAEGDALASLGLVRINLYNRDEARLLNNWEIAFFLVHEAAHVAWDRLARQENLDFGFFLLAIHDAVAHETHADFLESYLNLRIGQGLLDPGSAEARAVATAMFFARGRGQAVRQLMENPSAAWHYYDIDLALAEPELAGHPDTYVRPLVEESLVELLEAIFPSQLAQRDRVWLVGFFERIMSGEISLQDPAVLDNLTDSQVELLAFVFNRAYEGYPNMSRPVNQGINLDNYAVTQLLFYLLVARQAENYLASL